MACSGFLFVSDHNILVHQLVIHIGISEQLIKYLRQFLLSYPDIQSGFRIYDCTIVEETILRLFLDLTKDIGERYVLKSKIDFCILRMRYISL